ncbi:MAG: UDP-N-acetylglucosamine-peptide N-acetylglucosaminyltransferase [Hyphomicrobiales bacterium]
MTSSGPAAAALESCNWSETKNYSERILAEVPKGNPIVSPLMCLAYHDDPALQAQCARLFLQSLPVSPAQLPKQPPHDGRIRVAYLSADFHDHATAYLLTELIELHDRDRLDVVGISISTDYKGSISTRLTRAFGKIHAAGGMSDWEAAKFVYSLGVDIAIDLKGYTADCRPGIFAHRPAPIQAAYLGYPGAMEADFIDYVVADSVVVPFDQQSFYRERIVHLADCYQANDRKKEIAATPARAACGLPSDGFVFCCFNANHKISASVFDIWARLLKAVPGSVLWLIKSNDDAEHNLKEEAARRGVDPARLIFAPKRPLPEHLARYRLADLFLDTLPFNAHTTASDALWAGCPLLTCQGQTFAARVASSLLTAIGLPELITASLEEYEALALRLATDRNLLAETRRRLAQNRLTYPLFDTPRFCRSIETAYTLMWERYRRGEPPRGFACRDTDSSPLS